MSAAREIRRSMGEMLLPAVLAGVLAIIATVLAQKLVAPAIAAQGGWYSRWNQSFVGMIGAVAFFGGFLVVRRLMYKPRLEERRWLLSLDPIEPLAPSYREASPPTVHDLVELLNKRGYHLEASQVDESGQQHGPADLAAPLAGAMFDLRDARLPGGSRVIVQVSSKVATEGGGMGTVAAIEGGRKQEAEELALYTICDLAQLVAGLEYKDMDSALTPDSTEMLAAALPERPRAL